MASLIVLADGGERWGNDESLRRMVRSVRPYGGKIWLPTGDGQQACLARLRENGDGPTLSAGLPHPASS